MYVYYIICGCGFLPCLSSSTNAEDSIKTSIISHNNNKSWSGKAKIKMSIIALLLFFDEYIKSNALSGKILSSKSFEIEFS